MSEPELRGRARAQDSALANLLSAVSAVTDYRFETNPHPSLLRPMDVDTFSSSPVNVPGDRSIPDAQIQSTASGGSVLPELASRDREYIFDALQAMQASQMRESGIDRYLEGVSRTQDQILNPYARRNTSTGTPAELGPNIQNCPSPRNGYNTRANPLFVPEAFQLRTAHRAVSLECHRYRRLLIVLLSVSGCDDRKDMYCARHFGLSTRSLTRLVFSAIRKLAGRPRPSERARSIPVRRVLSSSPTEA